MFMPILRTKLFIPPTRKEIVRRQRLIDHLSKGMGGKLTLVSGPAGFGKTTLLSAWVVGVAYPVGWVSLDEGDNDWRRFITLLSEGFQNISNNIADDMTEMLYASERQENKETLITYLINQAALIPTPFLLVFDDYHVITNAEIHQSLQFILENQPEQMHLVVATRSDPPWTLARLRARGELSEIRARDLRFTRAETALFMNEIMGLNLSNQNVEQLETRIEGWAAGLQMAALSMQKRDDIANFIENFSGSHRYVFDYLLDEVFHRLSPDMQDFLLATSILDRLCAPLCDHVRSANDSQTILDQLDQMNLFLIPLDERRGWYRYHHLFAELIQQVARQQHPEQIAERHHKAMEWYQNNGSIGEAIHHGLAAGNFELVADLIERNFLSTLERRDWMALTRWLAALPVAIIQSRPWLNVAYAYVLLSTGSQDEVARLLQQAENTVEKIAQPESDHIRSYIAYIRAELAAWAGDISTAIGAARQALEHIPEQDKRLQCSTASTLGTALQRCGTFEEAAQAFADGIAAGRTIGDSNAVISLYGDLIGLFVERGKLHQAYAYCQEALQFIDSNYQRRGRYTPGASHIHFRLSTILRHWNDLENSLQHARISDEILKKWGLRYRLNYVNLAIAYHAVENYPEAHRILRDAEQITKKQSTYWIDDVTATRVSFWLVEGNLVAASQWALERKLDTERDLSYQNQLVYRTLAHVRVVQGQDGDEKALAEALQLLSNLESMYTVSGATAYLLQTFILQALAFQAQGKTDHALKSLKKAITLGEGGGYVRVFLRAGAPMQKLLHRAFQSGPKTAYVEKLIKACEKHHQAEGKSISDLIDPLTDRELEILQCLDSESTIPEIADSLIISVGTVRTHIKRIYRKLNVHSRFEAIVIAKQLNLIEHDQT